MAVQVTPVMTLTTWQFGPLVSGALVVLAASYLAAAWAVGRRHPARPWPVWRAAAFLAGLAMIAAATQGADAVYDDVLLRAHMVQHLLLIMIAPPLLVYGRPVTLALHAARGRWHGRAIRVVRSPAVSALTWPPFGVLLYSAVVLSTHLTPLVLARGWLHDGEHLAYVVAGYLLFLPVVGSEPLRRRPSLLVRYLLLLAAMPSDMVVGAAYMVARPFGGYQAGDVHVAGLIMLAGGELVMTAVALVLAIGLVRQPFGRHGPVPMPGLAPAAARDERLDAYNAHLAALDARRGNAAP